MGDSEAEKRMGPLKFFFHVLQQTGASKSPKGPRFTDLSIR